jgi:hypothetical protein
MPTKPKKVMAMLGRNDNDPQNMRALLAALADCQKISRLSLSASTGNQIASSPPPVEDFDGVERMSNEEIDRLEALLAKALGGPVSKNLAYFGIPNFRQKRCL